MQREERVTVQGPIKEQQPDGMSHRGASGGLKVQKVFIECGPKVLFAVLYLLVDCFKNPCKLLLFVRFHLSLTPPPP